MITGLLGIVFCLLCLSAFQWLKQNELEDRIDAVNEFATQIATSALIDRKYLQELGPAVTNVLIKHDERLTLLG